MGIFDFFNTKNEEEVVDPICLMKINKANCKYILKNNDKEYFFCSEGCLDLFKSEINK